HRHYCLVLDIIGRALTELTSSHELVSVIQDSLVTHRSTYAAGILHHDLSPGNIVIVKGVGYLIDWDLLITRVHLLDK
ncbi:hypothetical protein K503DRAFT_695679, partial [Rhizopogon vinicolor AM-OR11-026]